MKNRHNNRGSILILALWTLSFLSIFAVHIGLKVQHRASLLASIEARSQAHYLAESGIKKAIASLRQDFAGAGQNYNSLNKSFRHHNPDQFKGIELGGGVFNVSYAYRPSLSSPVQIRYGFVDEEGKINVNTADRTILTQLMLNVITSDEEEAAGMAEAIIDWVEFGRTQATGFYSDDYYVNLEFPYEPKNAEFEIIEELELVRGFNQTVLKQLRPFITIYGDGRVNINTAPREVLIALGLEESVADKLISVRRGNDGIEATPDDYIFRKTFDVATEMKSFVELEVNEVKQIDYLNAVGRIKTNSSYYLMRSQGNLSLRNVSTEVACVYNLRNNKIEYWREK